MYYISKQQYDSGSFTLYSKKPIAYLYYNRICFYGKNLEDFERHISKNEAYNFWDITKTNDAQLFKVIPSKLSVKLIPVKIILGKPFNE